VDPGAADVGADAGQSGAPAGDDGGVRAACLAAAMDVSPGLPLVGYESGDDLARMKALGFTEIGPLRVWQAGS